MSGSQADYTLSKEEYGKNRKLMHDAFYTLGSFTKSTGHSSIGILRYIGTFRVELRGV